MASLQDLYPEKMKRLDTTNWDSLENLVAQHVDALYNGTYHPDDDDCHYIYEAAVEAVYGKDVWRKVKGD